MTLPEAPAHLAELGLPPGEAQPVFAEPWQAQAFALVVGLHARGLFTWPEWAETLSRVIAMDGSADDGSGYYRLWLSALEDLLIARGMVDREGVGAVQGAWERAAEATPHGRPIVLANDPVSHGQLAALAPEIRRRRLT